MDKNKIYIKAWYGDWEEVTKEKALERARWFFKNMPVGNDESRARKTNRHFQGIEFTLDELRGE